MISRSPCQASPRPRLHLCDLYSWSSQATTSQVDSRLQEAGPALVSWGRLQWPCQLEATWPDAKTCCKSPRHGAALPYSETAISRALKTYHLVPLHKYWHLPSTLGRRANLSAGFLVEQHRVMIYVTKACNALCDICPSRRHLPTGQVLDAGPRGVLARETCWPKWESAFVSEIAKLLVWLQIQILEFSFLFSEAHVVWLVWKKNWVTCGGLSLIFCRKVRRQSLKLIEI